MGKRLKHQRRGKGTPTYRAKKQRFKSPTKYKEIDGETIEGEITDIIDDPSRTTLIMEIKYETGDKGYLTAPEGVQVGERIKEGLNAEPSLHNITALKNIPEGYPIYNIENTPGDGGKIAKSSGALSWIKAKEGEKVQVRLPSKRTKKFNPQCRATIGKAAGGGRTEKPLLKAGKQHHKKKARGQKFPTVRGVKMAAVDHPFGGKEHHGTKTHKGKTGSPGQHVGSFGASRTGRKKGKKKNK